MNYYPLYFRLVLVLFFLLWGRLFKARHGKLPFYYGIGGRVKFEEEIRVGVRLPVGDMLNIERYSN
jgi:hypothetical protein